MQASTCNVGKLMMAHKILVGINMLFSEDDFDINHKS